MRLAKALLLAAVALLLAVYVFDCDALATPDQAMQCCGAMPCSPQGHQGQDCCKTMPTMHAPFVQPAAIQHVPLPIAVAALVPVSRFSLPSSTEPIAVASTHSPPLYSPPGLSPLRI